MRIHYTATVWHGGFYKYFGDALRSLGHEVSFFDESGSKSQVNLKRIITRLPGYLYKGDDRFRAAVSRGWLKSVNEFKPDLIIFQQPYNILPEAVRQAKEAGYRIFYWIDSSPGEWPSKDILAGMQYADKLFSIDRKWMTILFPPTDFIHLPLAGAPEAFHPLPGAKEEYDVVFAGSFSEASGDGYLRAKIISDVPDKFKVIAFGNGLSYWFKYFPGLEKRAGGSKILTDSDLNEIYSKSRMVLNIHSTGHRTSVSARTYEVGLAGAFQLVDWREDDNLFFPNDMLVNFRNAKEINGLIAEWLGKTEERERRAKETRDYVLAHHTWRHRAEEMMRYFKR